MSLAVSVVINADTVFHVATHGEVRTVTIADGRTAAAGAYASASLMFGIDDVGTAADIDALIQVDRLRAALDELRAVLAARVPVPVAA